LALVVWSSTLPGDFVFDDIPLVENDTRLQQFDLQRIFADTYWGDARVDENYRPTVLLSYALQYRLSNAAWTFHAVNVILNALAAWVAFLVLERVLGDRWLASLGACLWTVLAIHSEAVANIVGRAEILAALAVLAVWRFALDDANERRWWSIVLAAAVTFAGLGSKESTVIVVPLLPIAAWALRRPIPWRTTLATLVAFGAYWSLRLAVTAENHALVAAGKASLASRVDNPLIEVDRLTAAVNGLASLALYAWKTIFPWTLSADYSYAQLPARPLSDAALWAAALGVVVVVGIAGAFVCLPRKRPLWAFAVLLFPLAFAVTCNAVLTIGTVFAERLAFLPSLALPLLLAAVAVRMRRRAPIAVVFVLLIGMHSARSVVRSLEWQDERTLLAATARTSPNSTRAQTMGVRAELLAAKRSDDPAVKARHIDAAQRLAERAIEIDPENGRAVGRLAEAFQARGQMLLERGAVGAAREALATAVVEWQRGWDLLAAKDQSEPLFLLSRARDLLRLGRFADARVAMDEYVRFCLDADVPLQTNELHNAGLAGLREAQSLLAAGEFARATSALDTALADLDRAMEIGASEAQVRNLRGVCFAMRGDLAKSRGEPESRTEWIAKALAELDRAVAADSELANVYTNRGFCRFLHGDLEGAAADYLRGLDICTREKRLFHADTDSAWGFHRRLQDVYRRLGRETDAAKHAALADGILRQTQRASR